MSSDLSSLNSLICVNLRNLRTLLLFMHLIRENLRNLRIALLFMLLICRNLRNLRTLLLFMLLICGNLRNLRTLLLFMHLIRENLRNLRIAMSLQPSALLALSLELFATTTFAFGEQSLRPLPFPLTSAPRCAAPGSDFPVR